MLRASRRPQSSDQKRHKEGATSSREKAGYQMTRQGLGPGWSGTGLTLCKDQGWQYPGPSCWAWVQAIVRAMVTWHQVGGACGLHVLPSLHAVMSHTKASLIHCGGRSTLRKLARPQSTLPACQTLTPVGMAISHGLGFQCCPKQDRGPLELTTELVLWRCGQRRLQVDGQKSSGSSFPRSLSNHCLKIMFGLCL